MGSSRGFEPHGCHFISVSILVVMSLEREFGVTQVVGTHVLGNHMATVLLVIIIKTKKRG